MHKRTIKTILAIFAIFLIIDPLLSYPIDGYALTGIRRLLHLSLILDGKTKGTMPLLNAKRSILQK